MKEKNTVTEVSTNVNSTSDLDALIARVSAAQKILATYSQEQVDKIFAAMATAANAQRIPLAKMAVEETGMGIVEDKVIKNHFAAEEIYNKYRHTKTCGILEQDTTNGLTKIAEPLGIIAGVIPTTNPTSTTIFKSLISLKTRNGIIFSPHPRAKKCTVYTAKLMLEAAVAAGAPEGIIGWIEEPSIELTQHLMSHDGINLILATGGPGMVKSAYSSGNPALGVGAGNTPAIIDETADIKMAVSSILMSKTFDNGMICASEQSVIVHKDIYDEVRKEFEYRGAYLLNKKEKEKVAKTIIIDGKLNAKIVGQPAAKIAEMSGIKVPEDAKVLIGEASKIGKDEEFSYEKLSPVLAMYKADDFYQAVDMARDLVAFGGPGHTSVLYTANQNADRIKHFSEVVETGRMLINTPSSQGGIGDLYNFRLDPSLTLGCGSWGGNAASENIGVKHLMNIKNVAERRENMLWFRVPPRIYFKQGAVGFALRELCGKKKALIVTDKPLFQLGYTKKITNVLEDMGIAYQIFSEVAPDPDTDTVNRALIMARSFEPDVIIALGGGSPMDAAKIVWLMYEHPEVKFEDLAMRFMDIRKRVCMFPDLGSKAMMIAIPTTSGTGSEVTPFAVITDSATHIKYPIADYALSPNMAIVDPDLVLSMPKGLAAASGIDALTHALEALASILATPFTDGIAYEAIRLIVDNLALSVNDGANNPIARENMHYAATMAGMAFAQAFLGVCHSMAHKLGSAYNIPHGIANALLICQVVKFNANDRPTKQGTFSQYHYPEGKRRYAKVAEFLNLGGKNDDEKVEKLIQAISKLKAGINIPASIKDWGVDENTFLENLDNLSELAFDDQCTGANPAYPLISEIKQMYLDAYYGKI
ncbi:MAG: bifunctional acetaldehyde-CoA/alcohol dehydrogenase [Alphaproteobacteria bacterium]|nr:bifunctional acetaldehyde-CoA/alcohol dehydrogenase [Alphaproteobacteria bacterium]